MDTVGIYGYVYGYCQPYCNKQEMSPVTETSERLFLQRYSLNNITMCLRLGRTSVLDVHNFRFYQALDHLKQLQNFSVLIIASYHRNVSSILISELACGALLDLEVVQTP